MLIRKLNRNTYDVFGGTGFDNWTRVRRFHWGLKAIAGVFLPYAVMRQVSEAVAANPNRSLDNV